MRACVRTAWLHWHVYNTPVRQRERETERERETNLLHSTTENTRTLKAIFKLPTLDVNAKAPAFLEVYY